MSQQKIDEFSIGLSEAEKHDLEKMIDEFRQHRPVNALAAPRAPIEDKVDRIAQRLADLTEMLLNIDRRMAPLVEVIRLSHQKSELLNQRLDAVIVALKKGHML